MFKFFGRYTEIIAVIIVFLMLIVSVLGLNFYMSFQVEANAEKVNIAGRQRMLSQRVAKSLLDTQHELNVNGDVEATVFELKSSSELFDETLNAFDKGGEVLSPTGEMTFIEAVTTERSIEIVQDTHKVWDGFLNSINLAIAEIDNNNKDSARVRIEEGVDFSHSNTNTILSLMNDLTNDQESIANKAASRSRLIQALGIVAAFLCFLEIMRRISGKLRIADQVAEDAQHETQQIFDTVDQGLFLIDDSFVMSDQYSKELVTIFADDDVSHRQLSSYLSGVVSPTDLSSIERYMKLLFDASKRESLIADLNPLQQISIQTKTNDLSENKYIRFNFSRVKRDDVIERVLVSVNDITNEVKLSQALERETKRGDKQIELVTSIINADRTLMPIYLENSRKSFNEINRLLQAPVHSSAGYKDKATVIMGLIHGVKGESSALSLDNITDVCHEFEGHLSDINTAQNVDGHNFVELTVLLNKLMSYNTLLSDLCDTLFGSKEGLSDGQSNNAGTDWSHLHNFSTEIAERQNKQISLHLAGLNASGLPQELIACVSSISSQLIRNAISHGIEMPNEREYANKLASGLITISLFNVNDGGYRYVFCDDGAGIDFAKVAAKAVSEGIVSEEKAQQLTKLEWIKMLFSSELSTADDVDVDKGRGIGMVAIFDAIKELDGAVFVKTSTGNGTTFTVDFPQQAFNSFSNAQEKALLNSIKNELDSEEMEFVA